MVPTALTSRRTSVFDGYMRRRNQHLRYSSFLEKVLLSVQSSVAHTIRICYVVAKANAAQNPFNSFNLFNDVTFPRHVARIRNPKISQRHQIEGRLQREAEAASQRRRKGISRILFRRARSRAHVYQASRSGPASHSRLVPEH